jgi:tripartite-type tricarboxylate transporter receptor subunit TctC
MDRIPRFRPVRRSVLGSLAGLACAAPLSGVVAQETWPSRPIRLVIPYPPGGTTDIVGRTLAEQLTRELGQTVLVDNRPGGGTNIGAEAVATAKPDGYTLFFAGITQVTNPTFGPTPPFDTLKAFEPVGLIATAPFMIAINPKTPVTDVHDLVAKARARPDSLTVSSAQLDIFVELLNARAGMKLLHVPYKGGAAAATDAIGGQVSMVFAQVPALLGHLQSGRLKPIAVSSAKRFPALPDLPTFSEAGIDYDVNPWFGLLAPAGTPRAAIERTTQAMARAIASAEMSQKIRSAGAEPGYAPPDEFAAVLRRDTAFWAQVGKALPHLIQK